MLANHVSPELATILRVVLEIGALIWGIFFARAMYRATSKFDRLLAALFCGVGLMVGALEIIGWLLPRVPA